ncbi:hypothetical protein YPPY02_4297, partial [Yersinia pestis PY-02]|jgi:hypothetical protein
MSSQ